MSPPAPSDATPPQAPAARPKAIRATGARRIDRLTTALLAASVGITFGAATPSFLVAAGVDLPSVRAQLPGAEPAPIDAPLALPHRPPEILGHPEGAEYPFDPDGEEDAPEPHGQVGLTRRPLVLHEQPAGRATVVGEVQAGEMVTVLRVAGDWALVYYNGGDLVVGWAKKSEIAIR
jgi:hypothetical protein